MAIHLIHSFVSSKLDGVDTSVVRPSNWNAEHTIYGTVSDFNNSVTDGNFISEADLGISVASFGAIGDGSTDDSVAIQNAINSISSGVVILQPKIYLINTGLILKPGVSLVSIGGRATLKAGTNSISLLSYTNILPTTLVTDFYISNINLQSNNKTGCTGIDLNGGVQEARLSNITLSDIHITGTFNTGIKLLFCANSFISNIFMISCIDGFNITTCTDTDMVNVKVQSGTGTGYKFTGGAGAFDEGTRLTNCSTNGQTIGLSLSGIDWGICTGCSFTTAPSGPLVTIGTNSNWRFIGCEFAVGVSPTQAGINLSTGSTFFQFSGCLFSNNTFGAVIAGTFTSITGCTFTGNSNVDIYLSSAQHTIISNTFINSTGTAQSIFELTSNYSNITGNQANGSIVLVGTQSVQTNNLLY